MVGEAASLRCYPRIEVPPFDDENVLRVVRTGSCLYLRAEPGNEGGILDCLPEETRLLPQLSPDDGSYDGFDGPSLVWGCFGPGDCSGYGFWVYVRTGDGAEGWVAHEYLDWY